MVPASTRDRTRLGSRADQPADGERPGPAIALAQLSQEPPGVDRGGGPHSQVAREDDLVEVAAVDALDGAAHRPLPVLRGQRTGGELDADGRLRRFGRRERRDGRQVGVMADGRHPPAVTTPADDDLGDHHHAPFGGVVREGQRPEHDWARTRLANLVPHHRVGHDVPPPLVGAGEAVGTRHLERRCAAPPDQPLAVPHPGDELLGGGTRQQREKGSGIRDRVRANHQR
jgi:hypothetical protein